MWPWKKKTAAPAMISQPRNSFFSADGDFTIRENPAKRTKRMSEYMALTFERTVDDLKPVDENGNAIATDNADLTSVKMRSGLGGYIPETQFAWYCGQGFIGYQTAAIISQNWLVDKACSM